MAGDSSVAVTGIKDSWLERLNLAHRGHVVHIVHHEGLYRLYRTSTHYDVSCEKCAFFLQPKAQMVLFVAKYPLPRSMNRS